MASRRQRDEFDELVSRTLLIIIGLSALVVAAAVFYSIPTIDDPFAAIGGIFVLIGVPVLLVGMAGSKKTACRWACNTGNHEVVIVFLLAALGISYVIRKLSKST